MKYKQQQALSGSCLKVRIYHLLWKIASFVVSHKKEKSKCPAFGKICTTCKKENHFASKCSQKKRLSQRRKSSKRKPLLKHAVNQFEFDESEDEILSVSFTEEEINAVTQKHSNKILATMKIGEREREKLKCWLILVHPETSCLSSTSPKKLWSRNQVTPLKCTQSRPCQSSVKQMWP